MTIPRRVADNPAALSFRSESGRVLYSEDVYVGYRWYDTLEIEPLFPFGHGLSYTSFNLSNLEVSFQQQNNRKTTKSKTVTGLDEASEAAPLPINNIEQLLVNVRVANTGPRAGAEVVQVYIKPKAPTPLTASARDTITRPVKELKGFTKVSLDAGSAKTAQISLDILRATSYWNEMEDCWRSDAGKYVVLVGTSSRGAFLERDFELLSTRSWRGLRPRI